jgi:N-methylhydantoinase A
LIEIGRQNRPRLYDFNVRREPPLVPRTMRWGVQERVSAEGDNLARPSPRDLYRLTAAISRSGAESVALCFLFSFRNPENERRVARALRRLGIPVSVSHEILPEFREYERTSTVTVNAFLAPRLGAYLARLAQQVGSEFSKGTGAKIRAALNTPRLGAGTASHPPTGQIYVMQSSGGITSAARAAREPVRTILSGPAGGVVATAQLAKTLGINRAISFDMGGTSTDVCLLDGAPRTTHETNLADLPIAVPVLDVHSVGAGGGSLARVDAGGALRVGPESAGSVPGPICYGRGGSRPTVTDAHLLLGRLDANHFLGGSFALDLPAVEKHFTEFLRSFPQSVRKVGPKSQLALAQGIVAVSNATMERALRVISVERGYDPTPPTWRDR